MFLKGKNMKKEWIKARSDVGNIPMVLSLVKQGMADLTRGKRHMDYPFKLEGTQRRRSTRGEARVEAALLSASKPLRKCILMAKGIRKEIEFKANAAGLGNRREGNIIVDLFGLDQMGSPVAGEVKISDKNPWYAVVECAAQVALLRSDRQNLKEWLRKALKEDIRGRGSWGMVIAPKKYWRKKETECAKHLVEELRKKTKIRICCVSYDENKPLDEIKLNVEFGRPPSARQVKWN